MKKVRDFVITIGIFFIIFVMTSISVNAASYYVLTKKIYTLSASNEKTIYNYKYNEDGLIVKSSYANTTNKYKYNKSYQVKTKTKITPTKTEKYTYFYTNRRVSSAMVESSSDKAYASNYTWVSNREVWISPALLPSEYVFSKSGKLIHSVQGKLDYNYVYDADGFISEMKDGIDGSTTYTFKNTVKNGRLVKDVRYLKGKKYNSTKYYYKKININKKLKSIIRKQQYSILGMGVPIELCS